MRRLAICAYAFSAAVLFCVLLYPSAVLLPAAAGFSVLCAFCLLLRRRLPKFLCPLLLGLPLGCLAFLLWSQLILHPAEAAAGETRCVQVTVLDEPRPTSYGTSVTARMGRVKCRLYLDEAFGLEPGQEIALDAHFSMTEEKTGDDHYLSVGLPLFGYADSAPVLLGPAKAAWRFWPTKLGIRLRANIASAFDEKTVPFLTAILTGDRTALKEDSYFYAMLKESGTAHCVAVSGMHLSFLVAFLYVLLGRGRFGSLVCLPVILLFMAVTGFTASVVRAGIMQMAVCLAVLTKQEYDSHTALALALAVMAAVNPYSLGNAGLILSFTSTLGILLFCEEISRAVFPTLPSRPKRRLPRLLLFYTRQSLGVSLSALIFTAPFTALFFGQFPLFGALTNLCILWAVELCFGFGLLAAILGLIWPAGAVIFGWPTRLLVRYIAALVKLIGHLPFASLYLQNEMVALWLILAYGLLAAYRFLPGIRRRFRGFLSASVLLLAVCCVLGCLLCRQDSLCAAVLDVGQGQCTVLTGRGFAVVADCGSSNQTDDPGDAAARYLLANGRTSIDALLISHFHSDHCSGAEELMRRLHVDTLIAPPSDGSPAAERLFREAEALRIPIVTVEGELLERSLNGLLLTIVPPLGGGDEEQGLCALFSLGEYDVLYTGDASVNTELRLIERLELPDVELLTGGHHGSARSLSGQLLSAAAPDTAVISVGRNNYGQPNPQALGRLAASGAAVYRTDLCGNVEIRFR